MKKNNFWYNNFWWIWMLLVLVIIGFSVSLIREIPFQEALNFSNVGLPLLIFGVLLPFFFSGIINSPQKRENRFFIVPGGFWFIWVPIFIASFIWFFIEHYGYPFLYILYFSYLGYGITVMIGESVKKKGGRQ